MLVEPAAGIKSFLKHTHQALAMKDRKPNNTLIEYGSLLAYCVLLLCVSVNALKKPAYNWDMLPYMGVVLSYNGNAGIDSVHRKVYAIGKEQIPAVFYGRMIDPANTYRSAVAQDVARFRSQLPFYIVKPLYTRLAYWFYKMGANLTTATVWPSVISYCLAGLLFFHWCKKYWNTGYAFAGSSFVMLSPPLLTVAGLSTPDALSAFLLFAAVYMLTETFSVAGACIFLVLSVFARLDNILPAVAMLVAVFFGGERRYKISAAKNVFIVSVLLLVYFAVAGNARAYGWSILYYPAFVKQLNTSYTANPVFSFSGYAALVKSQLATGFYFSFISIFLFLAIYYLWNIPVSIKKLPVEQLLILLFVLVIALRFILQPLVNDRLYIPYYLSLFVFLIKKNSLLHAQPICL